MSGNHFVRREVRRFAPEPGAPEEVSAFTATLADHSGWGSAPVAEEPVAVEPEPEIREDLRALAEALDALAEHEPHRD